MPGPSWSSIFRVWKSAYTKDPISKKTDIENIPSAGVSNRAGVGLLDLRNQMDGGSESVASITTSGGDTLASLDSVQDRSSRYKEYERLRNIPEIENCMTVFADEACVAGNTKVSTLANGTVPISWLAEKKDQLADKFLVYCFDFKKEDISLGWAYNPRKTGTRETVKVTLDDGSSFTCTPDHRVLLNSREWSQAGDLKFGDELLPFHKIQPNPRYNKLKSNLFPRIYTYRDGWTSERLFADTWRTGRQVPYQEKVQKAVRLLASGLTVRETTALVGHEWKSIYSWLQNFGYSTKEVQWLGKQSHPRRVIGVSSAGVQDVYDISVEDHKCFATDRVILHNCQKDSDGHVCKVTVDDHDVKEEAEWFLYKHIDVDKHSWNWFKNDIIAGDGFYELKIDTENPEDGVAGVVRLPQETMFRIETIKGREVEYQQSKDGPDYEAITKVDVHQQTEEDMLNSKAIRFHPSQIVHVRHGEDRKEFYPYGVSLIEPARGPAHLLKLMEDAMLVYRVSRATERRIFYIDVGTISGARAETFVDRMKSQFKKRKTTSGHHGTGGSAVEERWHAPAIDEDFWVPIRPNSNTRIETLPGACLALDTRIPFLDGKERTLQEAIDAFDRGERLWAYSCCPVTGKSAPGLVTWAGVTRKDAQVVRVTFDNGESVVCTPDHKFPIQGKGKIEAKDLQVGDSAFPFAQRTEQLSTSWKSKYPQVYDTSIRDWVFDHRMVKACVKNTQFDYEMVHDESLKDEKKTVVHHGNHNRKDNTPENLFRMNWHDHKKLHRDTQEITNQKISQSLVSFHENLIEEAKQKRNKTLVERSRLGQEAMKRLRENEVEYEAYMVEWRKNITAAWTRAAEEGADWYIERNRKITQRNLDYWSDPENKKKVFAKQTINYPKVMFDEVVRLTQEGLYMEDILSVLEANPEIMAAYKEANRHVNRKVDFNSLGVQHAKKMVKAYGYKNIHHFRKEVRNYNHKVVSVEWLEEKVDTGTLTIDGNHLIHDYHTFAISPCGIYTCNSNLDATDDVTFFRRRLYIALNFPTNYLGSEDVNATRITLSAQDCRFARNVERLQSAFEHAMWEMVTRHLFLRGFPEDSYDDLKIKMTPPSDWRELSRAEVDSNRMNKATTYKSSQIYSDFDIYTKCLGHTDEESRELQSRMSVQKMADLKLQIIANNPAILGVGLPGDGQPELGTEAGGPSPDLMPPDGSQPPPPPGSPPPGPPPQGMSKYMDADTGSGDQGQQNPQDQQQASPPPPLPEPEEEDIRKYHMEIDGYGNDGDSEDIDFSEL